MKAKHLAGLDSLRFISISFVVLHHLFTFKSNFGLQGFSLPVLGLIGLYGIHFFFMGSGFLITYLLLQERTQKGSVSLKKFYLRRVLRIWPAYYLLIVLALLLALKQPFFRIPGLTDVYLASDYKKGNLLFLFFLPHIAPFHNPTAPYVHQTYTIGIEEQFYLLWGLLFYFFPRYVYQIFILLLVSMPLLNVLHQQLHIYTTLHPTAPHLLTLIQKVITYLNYSRLSTFAIGALFGYAYFFKKPWIYYFKLKSVQVAVYVVFLFSIITGLQLPYVQFEYMALVTACIMLIATFVTDSLINYSVGWMEYLGKISYGIYLFHIFAIVFAIKLLQGLFGLPVNTIPQLLLLCLLTLALSIFFGWLSYNYFERFFLKLKQRFSRV